MSFLSQACGRVRLPRRCRSTRVVLPAPAPASEDPAQPAPVPLSEAPTPPVPPAPTPVSDYPPPPELTFFLDIARERFLEPGKQSFHSLTVASDVTAAHMSVEECARLLMAVTEGVQAQVFERAGWYWPRVPHALEWQRFLRCLASLALECCLRQDPSLVELERESFGARSLPIPCRLLPDISLEEDGGGRAWS